MAKDHASGKGASDPSTQPGNNVFPQTLSVDKDARAKAKRQRPCVVWLTGLSGAGKSTLANLLEKSLLADGRHTYVIDGDNLRHGLNRDLGFNTEDRVENIRRAAEVAKLMVDAGLIVVVALISPFRAERAMARSMFLEEEFIEVFVDAPLAVAEARDPKGLYKRARRGEIPNFTGLDSPYEVPESPEVHVDTSSHSPAQAVAKLLGALVERDVYIATEALAGRSGLTAEADATS